MICETPLSAQKPLDNCWKHTFSLPISMFSAFGVSHVNLCYLLTLLSYLLKDLLETSDWPWGYPVRQNRQLVCFTVARHNTSTFARSLVDSEQQMNLVKRQINSCWIKNRTIVNYYYYRIIHNKQKKRTHKGWLGGLLVERQTSVSQIWGSISGQVAAM